MPSNLPIKHTHEYPCRDGQTLYVNFVHSLPLLSALLLVDYGDDSTAGCCEASPCTKNEDWENGIPESESMGLPVSSAVTSRMWRSLCVRLRWQCHRIEPKGGGDTRPLPDSASIVGLSGPILSLQRHETRGSLVRTTRTLTFTKLPRTVQMSSL